MKKKILVVDDDAAIVEAIQMMLEMSGYEVITSTDGKILYRMDHKMPDLVLLDIWMSGVDGRDLSLFLKKNKKTRAIPVIMLSANNDAESIAKKAGADGFLSKPFDMQELLDLLERFLKEETAP